MLMLFIPVVNTVHVCTVQIVYRGNYSNSRCIRILNVNWTAKRWSNFWIFCIQTAWPFSFPFGLFASLLQLWFINLPSWQSNYQIKCLLVRHPHLNLLWQHPQASCIDLHTGGSKHTCMENKHLHWGRVACTNERCSENDKWIKLSDLLLQTYRIWYWMCWRKWFTNIVKWIVACYREIINAQN